MSIGASRNAQLGAPAKRVVHREPLFPVWSPEGHMEMHPRHVVNDLVRFGTVRGTWYASDPAEMARRLPPHMIHPDQLAAIQATDAAMEDSPTGATVTPRLTALRAEITALGGAYQPAWGIKSLERALSALKAELGSNREFAVKDPTSGKSVEQLQSAVAAQAAADRAAEDAAA